jgi:hypothetical protein
MENKMIDPQQVKGWAVDADPENEPTYPMKKYTGEDHQRLNYERPTQQHTEFRDFHSNERPNVTAVYGVASPPAGLSGIMRRQAFKYSENNYMHWLTLMLADRVNVVEGIAADLKKGHVPNIFAEKGWKAEWQYNRKSLVTRVAVAAIITVGVITLLCRKKRTS